MDCPHCKIPLSERTGKLELSYGKVDTLVHYCAKCLEYTRWEPINTNTNTGVTGFDVDKENKEP